MTKQTVLLLPVYWYLWRTECCSYDGSDSALKGILRKKSKNSACTGLLPEYHVPVISYSGLQGQKSITGLAFSTRVTVKSVVTTSSAAFRWLQPELCSNSKSTEPCPILMFVMMCNAYCWRYLMLIKGNTHFGVIGVLIKVHLYFYMSVYLYLCVLGTFIWWHKGTSSSSNRFGSLYWDQWLVSSLQEVQLLLNGSCSELIAFF